ncbi:MAG: hypothetical protein H6636_07705 [Anaerolineales bacterium]|nr:hypothetical protein [Anaerolineales bacterium]
MKPVVLRFALCIRWLIPALWGWVLFVAYFFGLMEVLPWNKLPKNPFDWAFFVLLGLSFYGWIFVWNYKVIFGNTHLVVKTLWFPFFKPFSCAYEDIRWVMRGRSPYSIKIVRNDEQVLTLATRTLEGGEEKVIAELKARIKPEKIMSEVEVLPSLWGNPSYDRRQFVVSLIYVILLLIILSTLHSNAPLVGKAISSANFSTYIRDFSVDVDGSVWSLERKAFRGATYTIRHLTNGKTETWTFIDPKDDYFNKIAGDENGTPWVFKQESTFHWENGRWVEVPYPVAPEQLNLNLLWQIYDGRFWALIDDDHNKHKGLFEWNLASNESKIIPLPEDKHPTYTERLKRSSDGSLLLLRAYDEDARLIEVSRLNDQSWEELISFPAPENADISNVSFIDATFDEKGFFWLFVPKEMPRGYFFYRLNEETNQLESTDVTNVLGTEYFDAYRFEVDKLGRIWLSSTYFLRVLVPHWGEEAEQLVYYTRENSGIRIGIQPVFVDGKIWASYEPVWFDINTEKLSRPLPEGWDYSNLKFGIEFVGLIAITLFQYISLYILRRRAQHKNTTKTAQPTA